MSGYWLYICFVQKEPLKVGEVSDVRTHETEIKQESEPVPSMVYKLKLPTTSDYGQAPFFSLKLTMAGSIILRFYHDRFLILDVVFNHVVCLWRLFTCS